MKHLPIIFLLMLCWQAAYAQWSHEWSVGYSYAHPSGKMKQNIHHGDGIVADFHLTDPSGKYALGVDMNFNIYGHDKTRQNYTLDDGTTAEMDVDVTNSFTNLMASGRYHLVTGKAITPYVGFKVGYSWFNTQLNIYDPDDWDNCQPLETELLQKDGTWIYSLGGGVKYDLANVFKKISRDRWLIQLSAFYVQGGTVNYMNTDVPDSHQPGAVPNRTGDVKASFINTQTQVIHQHHVGYVYSSFMKMMDYRFTLTLKRPH